MKNYKFLIAIALIVCLACSVYQTYQYNFETEEAYQANVKEARESRELGVWVDAEYYYGQALGYKENLPLRLEIADFYLESGQNKKAVEWAEEFCEQYPKDVSAYEYLLNLYLQMEDYGSCFSVYSTVQKRKLHSEEIEEAIAQIQYEYYLSGRYKEVGVFSDGMCAVREEEKWGYISLSGSNPVSSQFLYAGVFSAGVAPVVDSSEEAYFVDKNGNKKIVVQDVGDIEQLGMMADDIFALFDGSSWSFYNSESEFLFGGYDGVSSFGNGIAAVLNEGSWTLINTDGSPVSQASYEGVAMDEKGVVYRCGRLFVKEDGRFYMIDGTGAQISADSYENADVFNADGYAAVEINGLWGFVNDLGEIVIEPEYMEAKSFSNGLAAVKTVNGWGYINADNTMVIADIFEGGMDFNSSGRAFVFMDGSWKLLSLYSY